MGYSITPILIHNFIPIGKMSESGDVREMAREVMGRKLRILDLLRKETDASLGKSALYWGRIWKKMFLNLKPNQPIVDYIRISDISQKDEMHNILYVLEACVFVFFCYLFFVIIFIFFTNCKPKR